MDCHNQPDFTDQNTIVYGHNMKNGSMFGTLDKYQDKELFEQHPEFYLYLPDKILKYRIFPAMREEPEVRDIGIISRKRKIFRRFWIRCLLIGIMIPAPSCRQRIGDSYAVYLCQFQTELSLSGTWKIKQ